MCTLLYSRTGCCRSGYTVILTVPVVHMHLYPITGGGGGAGGMGMGMEGGGGGAAPDPQIWNGALREPHSTGVALAASGDEII